MGEHVVKLFLGHDTTLKDQKYQNGCYQKFLHKKTVYLLVTKYMYKYVCGYPKKENKIAGQLNLCM
ncbi:MAG TPA: hypothetical protein PKW06_06195, partial [Cyclobacteriaceae bacterium]|nr:hypothetical protein [Cyclobacteriaceae bacterium]